MISTQSLLQCLTPLLALSFVTESGAIILDVPLEIDTTQVADYRAYRRHFSEALAANHPGQMAPMKKTGGECSEKDCALALAKANKTDHVVYGSVRTLGLETYFKAAIIDADGKNYFSQLITVRDPGEIQSAAFNMAEALAKHESAKAPTREWIQHAPYFAPRPAPRRRPAARHFYSNGASLGYAAALGSNYGRWKYRFGCEDAVVACPNDSLYFQKISGVKLGWNNWLEVTNRWSLEADLLWYSPIALGADLNLEYLINDYPTSPFLGGGIGGLLVYPDEGRFENAFKRNYGVSLNLNGGLILFRTRALNVVVRGQYHLTLDSDRDNGLSADLAIRSKIGGEPDDFFGHTPARHWVGLGLGSAFFLATVLGLAGPLGAVP